MRASYLLEAKYVCVHAKKGKYECEAESSYGAAKKAAEHWGLKGTSGIDAHLADKPKTATEGIEGMTPNTQVRGIMPKQRKPYHKHKIKSDHEPETDLSERDINTTVQEKEDDEYDPRRVKADVMKHLVDMYNDAKKDGGYTSEKMRFALGNLLHDMDMAGYMNSDYYDIEGFFHKGIDVKADEKINMGMLKKAYAQAKNLPDDTRVDPEIFNRGGSAMKSVATESKSMLGEVTRSLTEAEFDEAAGEKDACYRKVKSRYKVWPSAYASGALVKCRKVGAANWGNKSKK